MHSSLCVQKTNLITIWIVSLESFKISTCSDYFALWETVWMPFFFLSFIIKFKVPEYWEYILAISSLSLPVISVLNNRIDHIQMGGVAV